MSSLVDVPEMSPQVAAVFAGLPKGCLALRKLIFEVAASVPEVGRISEELRWGQPAYLTPDTRAGSTIRVGEPKAGGYALFVHCQTTLLSDFRLVAPKGLRFDGNRAVLFRKDEPPEGKGLELLIQAALSYHLKPLVAS